MAKVYKIVFRKSAEKQLLKLPKPVGQKVIETIKLLSGNPIPDNAQKMSGFEIIYKLRSGVYRVIYSIKNQELV